MALVQLKGTAHVRSEVTDMTIKELIVLLYREAKREAKEKLQELMR